MRWLAILFVALVLLAVWVASIFFPELRWIAWAVTGSVVLLIVTVLAVRWLRKRMKAAALEREMTKQTDPDRRPEIVALRDEMSKAVQALKKMRGRGGGAAALYGLPWYVIVGPSAVGKTTALERSGLSFVPSTAGAPKIRGNAGTRNCDWWFAREAILLDTAGRFATEDDDHDEWMAFLGSLQRLRPERPLDGLLVAVSVPDVVSANETEREALAAKLRARLDEVLQRLEMVLPVYVVLTKADLIAGFVEFWSDLGKQQRSQVWGASFGLDDPRLDELHRAIEAEFDLLAERLHARLLGRLPAERNPELRARIVQFPLEFRALRGPLAQFIEALCRPGADQQRPRLRGFYLTSATQVGRPVERVLAGMLRGFDPHGRLPSASPAEGEVHSYFLGDVFRTVMLPDRSAAARSTAGVERRSMRELRAALIALGLAAFALIPAVVSYVRNTQLVRDVDAAAEALRSAPPTSVPGTVDDPLEIALDTLDRLDEQATGFGIPGWFGPRAARELRGPLESAYLGRMHGALRARVAPDLERDLASIIRARRLEDSVTSPEDHTPLRNAYEVLKLYATLVDPKDHVELPWTAEQLAHAWQRTIPSGNPVGAERLARHCTNYLTALEAAPDRRWPATSALQDARAHLNDAGIADLPYHWAVRRAYDQPPLLASDVADASSLKYLTCPRDQVLVRGTYRSTAWERIGAALDSSERWPPEALLERWVVADMRLPKDETAIRARVREEYYENYSQEWMSLLSKCDVTNPRDFASAKDELTALKGPKGFYRTLFSQFAANSIEDAKKAPLPLPLPLSTEGCASKLGPPKPEAGAPAEVRILSPVQKTFQPLLEFSGDTEDAKKPAPLDKYATILETLRATLESAAEGTDPLPQFQAANHAVEALLDGLQEPTKGQLWRLLTPPVKGATAGPPVPQPPGPTGHDEWYMQVYSAWEKLSKLFPFNRSPGAHDAVAFEDFRSFFQANDGILWKFVKAKLANWVEQSDTGYVTKPGVNPMSADLLSCLSVAQEITDAFFDEKGPGLKISLQVDWSAPDVTEAKFWIGDKATALPRSQWSAPLTWNGEAAKLEWIQGGRPTQQLGRHSFSLFDLFQQLGGLKPSGGRGTYAADYPPLTVKARSFAKKDALRADFFSRLRCPPHIQMENP